MKMSLLFMSGIWSLEVKGLVLLGVVLSYKVCCEGYASKEDSDEDDKLKQALLLVDLLKSEYGKVLRENHAMKSTVIEELSTCPFTTLADLYGTSPVNPGNWMRTSPSGPSHALEHVIHQQAWPGLRKKPVPMQLQSFPPGAAQRPYGYLRRMMPIHYYDYDVPMKRFGNRRAYGANDFLRQDYQDVFGEHPNDTEKSTVATTPLTTQTTTTPPPTTTTTSTTSSAATTTSSTTTSSTTTSSSITTSQTEPSTTTTQTTTASSHKEVTTPTTELPTKSTYANTMKTSTFKIQKLKLPVNKNHILKKLGVSEKKDPVMSQVASELISEFKDEGVPLKNRFRSVTISEKRPRTKWTHVVHRFFRTTMKIHLAGSTRYPIPFPENHAFCYTNPNSALCRTLIK